MSTPLGDIKTKVKLTKADKARVARAAKKYGTVVKMPANNKKAVSMLAAMFGITK